MDNKEGRGRKERAKKVLRNLELCCMIHPCESFNIIMQPLIYCIAHEKLRVNVLYKIQEGWDDIGLRKTDVEIVRWTQRPEAEGAMSKPLENCQTSRAGLGMCTGLESVGSPRCLRQQMSWFTAESQNSVEAEVLLESIVLFRNYSKAIQLMPEID